MNKLQEFQNEDKWYENNVKGLMCVMESDIDSIITFDLKFWYDRINHVLGWWDRNGISNVWMIWF